MEQRTLGRTGLRVSLLGLGTGGANVFGQASGAGQDEARALVRAALDIGVDYFDTAAGYRDSEPRLAAALAGVPRHDYVLATKYHPRSPDGALLTPAEVRAALERSLRRLGTDVIDVYQVHALRAADHDRVVETHLPVLEQARDAGTIRAIGATESFAGDDPAHASLSLALDDGRFDVLMVGYNVLHQTAERDILPRARAAGIGIVIMAAVRRALASRPALEAQIAELKASGAIVADAVPDSDPLGWLVDGGSTSVQAACYRFVAGQPAVGTVLTGTFHPAHLSENAAAVAAGPLPAADQDRLRSAFGHLDTGLGR